MSICKLGNTGSLLNWCCYSDLIKFCYMCRHLHIHVCTHKCIPLSPSLSPRSCNTCPNIALIGRHITAFSFTVVHTLHVFYCIGIGMLTRDRKSWFTVSTREHFLGVMYKCVSCVKQRHKNQTRVSTREHCSIALSDCMACVHQRQEKPGQGVCEGALCHDGQRLHSVSLHCRGECHF